MIMKLSLCLLLLLLAACAATVPPPSHQQTVDSISSQQLIYEYLDMRKNYPEIGEFQDTINELYNQ